MSMFAWITKFKPVGGMSDHAKRQASGLQVTTGAEGELSIQTPDPTGEDSIRDQWFQTGLKLARQEDWHHLCNIIQNADRDRHLTPGGMSVAELVADGARSDVAHVFEEAFEGGRPSPTAPILDGIEALERVLCDMPDNHAMAMIVARAHMDMAWIWRGQKPHPLLSDLNQEAFEAHMDRARDILEAFCGTQLRSPSVLSTICGLPVANATGCDDIVDRHRALIDLNPLDYRQFRLFGTRLLPKANGSYETLDLEARRAASRYSSIWGTGSYSWIMFDAICQDPEAMAGLEIDHFIKGLKDILALQPDQHTVNLLAAYCSLTMNEDCGSDAADFNRARIHSCRDWIICDYLTELHPLIWAHAAHGFDNALKIQCPNRFAELGLQEAHRVLKSLFIPELARGQNVIFTGNGPVTVLP